MKKIPLARLKFGQVFKFNLDGPNFRVVEKKNGDVAYVPASQKNNNNPWIWHLKPEEQEVIVR